MKKENITYCLDSNAVSDILRKRQIVVERLNNELISGNHITICSIVYYEIVRGLKSVGAYKRLAEFHELYDNLPLKVFLDKDDLSVIERATDIYANLHRGQQIEDNDIYIAAIAIENNLPLVTDNIKHFGRIEGLKIVNWREE
ncbi:MAG: PIN domain-containing protein [Selenomonadaceae bacterium]|nr:PIN domain-containing protein [Selenomonadaceae bacterium]MBP3722003.1 PIN domain-containing protein [Selenomonadaceae bacterium]